MASYARANEALSIGRVLADLPANLVTEILVVDNDSTDGTPETAARMGARVIREPRRGYGRACLTGLAHVIEPDIVVFLDGDYSDRPIELPRVLAPIIDGRADITLGSRLLGSRTPGALPWHAAFGNRLAAGLITWLFGQRTTDLGPFRAVRADVLDTLALQETTYGWAVEMVLPRLADDRCHRACAGFAVKFLPIVRIRDGLVGVLVFGLLYAPFLERGRIPIGSLGTYVQRFRFNDPVFAMLERVASPQMVASLAVLVGLVTAGWLRNKPRACWADQWAWPLAASLACAPMIYPWYLLWLLPFLSSATSTLPLRVWTVSILPTYIVWHLRSLGLPWRVPGWVLLLGYGSVAVAVALVALRRMPHPDAPPDETLPGNDSRVN